MSQRRREIFELLQTHRCRRESMPDGFSFTFEASPGVLLDIARLVELERQCCQFLTFKIVVAPEQFITLEITGPPAAKAVIAEFL